jgi:hypothetical protein
MVIAALQEAGRAAAARLADSGCARVFSDFTDEGGRTLQQRLDAMGRSGRDQLQGVYFYDGVNRHGCQRGRTLAVTEPGSVVVHVCPRFVLSQRQDPKHAPVVLIHELLHTLGLGENQAAGRARLDGRGWSEEGARMMATTANLKPALTLKDRVVAFERRLIIEALEQAGGQRWPSASGPLRCARTSGRGRGAAALLDQEPARRAGLRPRAQPPNAIVRPTRMDPKTTIALPTHTGRRPVMRPKA